MKTIFEDIITRKYNDDLDNLEYYELEYGTPFGLKIDDRETLDTVPDNSIISTLINEIERIGFKVELTNDILDYDFSLCVSTQLFTNNDILYVFEGYVLYDTSYAYYEVEEEIIDAIEITAGEFDLRYFDDGTTNRNTTNNNGNKIVPFGISYKESFFYGGK